MDRIGCKFVIEKDMVVLYGKYGKEMAFDDVKAGMLTLREFGGERPFGVSNGKDCLWSRWSHEHQHDKVNMESTKNELNSAVPDLSSIGFEEDDMENQETGN